MIQQSETSRGHGYSWGFPFLCLYYTILSAVVKLLPIPRIVQKLSAFLFPLFIHNHARGGRELRHEPMFADVHLQRSFHASIIPKSAGLSSFSETENARPPLGQTPKGKIIPENDRLSSYFRRLGNYLTGTGRLV